MFIYIYKYVHIRSSSGRLRLFTYEFVHMYVRMYAILLSRAWDHVGPQKKIRKRAEGLNLRSESYLILARIPKRHASNLRNLQGLNPKFPFLKTETARKAPFAERAVQTIKNMIHARIEGLDLPVEKWVEMLPAILKQI